MKRLYPSVMSSEASEQPFSTRHMAMNGLTMTKEGHSSIPSIAWQSTMNKIVSSLHSLDRTEWRSSLPPTLMDVHISETI
jgi:hypothetical protein